MNAFQKIVWSIYMVALVVFLFIFVIEVAKGISTNTCTEEAVAEFQRREELVCKQTFPCFIEDDLELHMLDVFKDDVLGCF